MLYINNELIISYKRMKNPYIALKKLRLDKKLCLI